jgi:hypothetical protein
MTLRGRRHPTPRDREPMTLRGRRHPTPPRQGNRSSSEHRQASFTETGQPEFFGTTASQFHRDREPMTLRGRRHPTPIGSGTAPLHGMGPRPPGQRRRHPSGSREPRLTGTGNLELFGARAPPYHRARTAATPRGRGHPGPTGQGHPASRGKADGALRSTARRTSPASGHRRSSEQRRPGTVRGNPTATLDYPPFGAGRYGKPRQGITGVRRALRRAAIGTETDLGREPSRAGR